jgi:hypothetical protein
VLLPQFKARLIFSWKFFLRGDETFSFSLQSYEFFRRFREYFKSVHRRRMVPPDSQIDVKDLAIAQNLRSPPFVCRLGTWASPACSRLLRFHRTAPQSQTICPPAMPEQLLLPIYRRTFGIVDPAQLFPVLSDRTNSISPPRWCHILVY